MALGDALRAGGCAACHREGGTRARAPPAPVVIATTIESDDSCWLVVDDHRCADGGDADEVHAGDGAAEQQGSDGES